MVSTTWLTFAGVEIINSARVAAYAGGAGMAISCPGCTDLPASLGDQPYTDPVSDDAPWYDPAVVESKDFLGVLGLEFTGASDNTAERSVTEYLGDGGVPGSGRHASREIEVSASLIATTEAAVSYGMSWLATALEGHACQGSCLGDTVCLYAACPTRPTLANSSDDDCSQPGHTPDPDWDPITGGANGPGGDQLLRQGYNAALLEGPTRESVRRLQRGWVASVSFTITAGNPWWWKLPVTAFTQDTLPDYSDHIPNYDILEPSVCDEPVDCLDGSPYCTGTNKPWPDEPFPGSAPSDTTLIDPCFPTEPFPANRSMWRVGTAQLPEWQSTAPIVTLYSGSLPLHRVTLRWYTNARNKIPNGNLDGCDACTEMTIPWIPSRTTLVLDSRTRSATVDCRGQGSTVSGVTVYGPRGGTYTWPTFDCNTPLVAELLVHANSVNPDMRWSVDLASRVGAA